MARIQPLPQAALPQYEPIFQLIAGLIEPALVQLVAHVASAAAGCQCCQAHTATHAHHLGVDTDKIAGVWMFETHELFSGAERAALRLARDAAQIPNLATDDHFAALAEHYDEAQIVQIVAVISLFGYLNRWNDTMASTLEAEPLAFATQHLAGRGWQAGKHQPHPGVVADSADGSSSTTTGQVGSQS